MPRCYLLAVAQGSSIDFETNHLSLFDLAEEIGLHVDQSTAIDGLEIHCYWALAESERSRDYEVRFLIKRKTEEFASSTHVINAASSRLRMRTRGVALPGTGPTAVHAEWREAGGSHWTDSGQSWPLEVKLVPGSDAPRPGPSG